jgi:perosamine synthetase
MSSESQKADRTTPRAPRLDLHVSQRVADVLASGKLNAWYGGKAVQAFEHAFAQRFGRNLAVACNSGTSALHLAYAALELPPGSEVLIPANAYVSAASAALQCDLVPVFVDIHPKTWVMDLGDLSRKITNRSRVIVPVHMYGQPCDMDGIDALAADHRLTIIEDAAAAHGATWRGRPIGSFGLASCFSVCCFKLVTAGEGGVVTTNDPGLAGTVRSLAHKGKGEGFFDYIRPGFSYHMSELQAAVAHDTLADIDGELDRRRANADFL